MIVGPFGSPLFVVGSSCLLSNEKGGIRQSNMYPSSLSIRNVPLLKCNMISWHFYGGYNIIKIKSKITAVINLKLHHYHICPLGACSDTCEEYWKEGRCLDKIGSSPTTPRPLTVSRVPDKENILQFLSLSVTVCSPKFSSRIQYLHWKFNMFFISFNQYIARFTYCSWQESVHSWYFNKLTQ